jgi:hypothetical protein
MTMSNQNSIWKRNLLAIAAAVTAFAATSSAQDVTLKATIPFAFSINRNANLAPGDYVVTRDRNVWQVSSKEAHRTVLLIPIPAEGKANEKPSLTFACVNSHCQLRAIHAGGFELGAEIPAPKLSKSDAEELAFVNVPLESNRGE